MSEQGKNITFLCSKLSIKLAIFYNQRREVRLFYFVLRWHIWLKSSLLFSFLAQFFSFLIITYEIETYFQKENGVSEVTLYYHNYGSPLKAVSILYCWYIYFSILSLSCHELFFNQMKMIKVVSIADIHKWISKFHLHIL